MAEWMKVAFDDEGKLRTDIHGMLYTVCIHAVYLRTDIHDMLYAVCCMLYAVYCMHAYMLYTCAQTYTTMMASGRSRTRRTSPARPLRSASRSK